MKIILNGYYGFGNVGDEFLALSIIKLIKKYVPDAKLKIICKNPKKMQKLFKVKCISRINPFSLIFNLTQTNIFVAGGGSLFQDVSSFLSFWYYFILFFMAKLLNCKLCFLYQGFGPFKSRFNKKLMRILLKFSSYISVRDKRSYEFVEKGHKKPVSTMDPVIWLFFNEKVETGNSIAVIPRSWKENNEQINMNNEISEFLNNTEYEKIYLVPFFKNDIKDCNKIAEKLNGKYEICEIPSSIENIKEIFNKIDRVVSVRLHGCIIAAALNKKCISVDYDIKVREFSREFNIDMITKKKNKILWKIPDYGIILKKYKTIIKCIKDINKL